MSGFDIVVPMWTHIINYFAMIFGNIFYDEYRYYVYIIPCNEYVLHPWHSWKISSKTIFRFGGKIWCSTFITNIREQSKQRFLGITMLCGFIPIKLLTINNNVLPLCSDVFTLPSPPSRKIMNYMLDNKCILFYAICIHILAHMLMEKNH